MVSMITYTPAAQSQVVIPVGLGISLGSMVLSGIGSRHQNRNIRTKNRAIDEYNRGTKLLDKEEYQEALAAFSEALKIDPNMAEAHWNSAIAYKKLENYDRCLSESLAVLDKRHKDAQALFMAADACQHLHKFVEADQYYQQYLEMDRSGNNAEIASRAVAIIENNFLNEPVGDYLADATREGPASWRYFNMPLKVFIKEDATVNGYMPEFSKALKDSFAEWEDVSDGKISFAYTDDESEAQIVCAWTGDKMQLGGTRELGLTHTMRKDSQILSARIDLYTLLDRKGLKKEEIVSEAQEVDLHEIGHALGLEHSSKPYDTMYFETTPDGLEFALTQRDKQTILALYSNSSRSASSSSGGQTRGSSLSSMDKPAVANQL
jgi:tetratricopeptide (TPR) repeat protein